MAQSHRNRSETGTGCARSGGSRGERTAVGRKSIRKGFYG
jgi:hypothetical protein